MSDIEKLILQELKDHETPYHLHVQRMIGRKFRKSAYFVGKIAQDYSIEIDKAMDDRKKNPPPPIQAEDVQEKWPTMETDYKAELIEQFQRLKMDDDIGQLELSGAQIRNEESNLAAATRLVAKMTPEFLDSLKDHPKMAFVR